MPGAGGHRLTINPQLLARDLALSSSFCATRPAGEGAFGMAVLRAFPALHQQEYNLSYGRREPRFCLRVDSEVEPGAVLHVFNCHLGLAARERAFQRKQMMSDLILLSKDLHHPVVLMGDFNDRPIPVVHRTLRRHLTDVFTACGKRGGDVQGGTSSTPPGPHLCSARAYVCWAAACATTH